VFELQNDRWVQLGNDISPPDGLGIGFAQAIAISGDGKRVAIGTRLNSDADLETAGQARMYEFRGGEWVQIGGNINGEIATVLFGQSVSMSADGSRVAIGSVYDGLRVFDYVVSDDEWQLVGDVIRDKMDGDELGWSVSLSADGNRVAVGSPKSDCDDRMPHGGLTSVFDLVDGQWEQVGQDVWGESSWDTSGHAVSLSADGTHLVIGSPRNTGGVSRDQGHARVFELKQVGKKLRWAQKGEDIDGEAAHDLAGNTVAISADGSRIAISAYMSDDRGTDSGHVRIFEWRYGQWVQIGLVPGKSDYDNAGFAISMSYDGCRVAVGAAGNDDGGLNAGHVRVMGFPACGEKVVDGAVGVTGVMDTDTRKEA
jgi:hypothetical protein